MRVYDGGHMPTLPDHFYLCHPCEADGAEIEGGAWTADCDGSATLAVDFPGRAPAAGDYAVATAVGGRWVAELGRPPCGPLGICALDCAGNPIAGAAVVVADSGGATVASGTTGGAGCVSFAVPPGTYAVTIAPPSWPARTTTIAFACERSPAAHPITFTAPSDLFLTDFTGTVPFTRGADGLWHACTTFTAPGVFVQTQTCNLNTFGKLGTGPVKLSYTGYCTSTLGAPYPPGLFLVRCDWAPVFYDDTTPARSWSVCPGEDPDPTGWYLFGGFRFVGGPVQPPTACAFLSTDCTNPNHGNGVAELAKSPDRDAPFAWSGTLVNVRFPDECADLVPPGLDVAISA